MSTIQLAALAVGLAACATDLRRARIPNALTLSAIALGVIFHSSAPAGHGIAAAGLGLIAGLLVFFPIFALGAMGGGDVKLMAALGTWLGWEAALQIALYGAAAGGVLAVIVSVWHGYLRRALSNVRTLLTHWVLTGVRPLPELTLESGNGLRLPYALPIMAGLVVTLWRQ
jgi:prepilin peptidase CpaA